jgi:hypothetical protein
MRKELKVVSASVMVFQKEVVTFYKIDETSNQSD